MNTNSEKPLSYILGHSDRELDRLSQQAQSFEPFTRQFFAEVGIEKGMRVLDIGCGGGDVTMLVAEMVGPAGHVIGADRAPEAVECARRRAKSRGITNVELGVILTAVLIALIYRREFLTNEPLPAVAARPARHHPSLVIKSVIVTIAMMVLFFAGQPVAKVAIVGGALLLLRAGSRPTRSIARSTGHSSCSWGYSWSSLDWR